MDRACCHKMTNYSKHAITLSISCPDILFLNCGKNGPGQFNFSGLFLMRPRPAFLLFVQFIFHGRFQHPSFLHAALCCTHPHLQLACVKQGWIVVEGHCKWTMMIVVEREETINLALLTLFFPFFLVKVFEMFQP